MRTVEHGRHAIVESAQTPNTPSTQDDPEVSDKIDKDFDYDEFLDRTMFFDSRFGVQDVEYPFEVGNVELRGEIPSLFGDRVAVGSPVSVRPVSGEGAGKTFLGVYLGDFPSGVCALYDKIDKTLTIRPGSGNPAILIPEQGRIVRGYESWWGPIKNEEDLREITDESIQNLWYIKALRELGSQSNEDSDTPSDSEPDDA